MSTEKIKRHHILLIPGFFGFSNLGGITYFHHVQESLEASFRERGLEANVISVSTYPTGSIRRRAARIAETLNESVHDDGPIHLIGHSTGGLDTRLMVTPNVALPTEVDVQPWARRVRSVVTIATPHLGTPMASLFNSVFGQNLMWAISLGTIYTLRFGKLPLKALVEMVGIVTHIDRRLGLQDTVREQFYRQLFKDFDPERRAAINEFLNNIRSDRAVVGQLTPGAIDLFNASTGDRRGVRYGSVITRAATLSVKALRSLKLDPYSHASHLMFRVLQFITARNGHFFDLKPEQELELVRAYGDLPSARSNDGVVPTLSQMWGEIIHIARADHLDVCGHFRDPGHEPPHVDWFVSGSGFRRPDFDALWGDVVDFMLPQ